MNQKVKKLNKIITKKILLNEYINNEKTIHQIANKLNCGYNSIRNRLIKFNIKIKILMKKNLKEIGVI